MPTATRSTVVGRGVPSDPGQGACGSLVAAGVDVRHLRPFKSAAEREVSLADHVLGQQALRDRGAGAAGLDDATVRRQVLEDCLELHVALVRAELG